MTRQWREHLSEAQHLLYLACINPESCRHTADYLYEAIVAITAALLELEKEYKHE